MSWKVQAKQNFLEQRTPAQLKEIPVKEWGISVYYWPKLSMAEKRAVANAYRAEVSQDVQGAQIEQIIVRARDEHGDALFSEKERGDLMQRYDPAVIERVTNAMMADAVTTEDAEKN